MLYTEFLSNNRIHTYSDTFKIRQLDTGIIYDDAIDTVSHEYNGNIRFYKIYNGGRYP